MGTVTGEVVSEVGGGLNFKRPLFLKVIDRIEAGAVGCLVVAHRDRQAFGHGVVPIAG